MHLLQQWLCLSFSAFKIQWKIFLNNHKPRCSPRKSIYAYPIISWRQHGSSLQSPLRSVFLSVLKKGNWRDVRGPYKPIGLWGVQQVLSGVRNACSRVNTWECTSLALMSDRSQLPCWPCLSELWFRTSQFHSQCFAIILKRILLWCSLEGENGQTNHDISDQKGALKLLRKAFQNWPFRLTSIEDIHSCIPPASTSLQDSRHLVFLTTQLIKIVQTLYHIKRVTGSGNFSSGQVRNSTSRTVHCSLNFGRVESVETWLRDTDNFY